MLPIMKGKKGEAHSMQISSRFTIAVHIFACIDTFETQYKITSEFLASSIQVNPVVIRKILSQLKANGLITVQRGSGARLWQSRWRKSLFWIFIGP